MLVLSNYAFTKTHFSLIPTAAIWHWGRVFYFPVKATGRVEKLASGFVHHPDQENSRDLAPSKRMC